MDSMGTTKDYRNISFYRYTGVSEPEMFRERIRKFCAVHDILGRILVAKEGINGAVSGKEKDIVLLKIWLRKHFPQLSFREQAIGEHCYHKLVVLFRNEMVHFGEEVDLSHTGNHVSPKELEEWINNEEVVLLDARNDYEIKVGKFKNALTLPINTFREFPQASKKLEHLKEKKIVMYCTGGVRCEKASAYLKEQGFKDVHQLDGGIINYLNQFPHASFEGNCFVFDDRLVAHVPKQESITLCASCGKNSDEYINCHNLDCDDLVIQCQNCQKNMHKTCSEECMKAPRQRKEKKKALPFIGKVENYYAQKHIALIKIEKGAIDKQTVLAIEGKTTKHFEQKIKELRHDEGYEMDKAIAGQLISFPVDKKVRRNDQVYLVA